jgi:hypothetical protein
LAARDSGAADRRAQLEATFTTGSTGRATKVRRASAHPPRLVKFHPRPEIPEMSKILGAAAAIIVIVVAIIAWSKFATVKPEAAAATNAAAEDRAIISPFDTTIKHSNNLPVEDWRPAN